jgi:putative oxidoreductase
MMLQFPPVVTDAALLLLRLLRLTIAIDFFSSGWNHLKDPATRAQSLGVSKGFTVFLGIAEVAGSLGVALGVLTQLAALGLILVMLGAISKKIFVWHTGLWGKDGYGWHYDLKLAVMSFVVLATDGGRWVLVG